MVLRCDAARSRLLIDASTAEGQQLFAVDLSEPGISIQPAVWVGAGMARADTRTVSFEGVRADPVGAPGQYLSRRGFWAGAIGVAACWHGGTLRRGRPARPVERHLRSAPARTRQRGARRTSRESGCAERRSARIDCHGDGDLAMVTRATRTTIERELGRGD